MSEKTPGQVAREEFWNGGRQTDRFDQIASAVIAHVRPQIERDARVAALKEAAVICRERAALILSESLGKNVAIECAELIEAARTK
jgi:hypothetical protein